MTEKEVHETAYNLEKTLKVILASCSLEKNKRPKEARICILIFVLNMNNKCLQALIVPAVYSCETAYKTKSLYLYTSRYNCLVAKFKEARKQSKEVVTTYGQVYGYQSE